MKSDVLIAKNYLDHARLPTQPTTGTLAAQPWQGDQTTADPKKDGKRQRQKTEKETTRRQQNDKTPQKNEQLQMGDGTTGYRHGTRLQPTLQN